MNPRTSDIDQTRFPHTAAFVQWFESEKENNGLVDVKFFAANVKDSTLESFCERANALISAAPIEHPELF